jgi:hypothetical protein
MTNLNMEFKIQIILQNMEMFPVYEVCGACFILHSTDQISIQVYMCVNCLLKESGFLVKAF